MDYANYKIWLLTTFEAESMHALSGQIRILLLLIKIIVRIKLTRHPNSFR